MLIPAIGMYFQFKDADFHTKRLYCFVSWYANPDAFVFMLYTCVVIDITVSACDFYMYLYNRKQLKQ